MRTPKMYAATNILDRWPPALPAINPSTRPSWRSAKSSRAPAAAATSRSSARTRSLLRSTSRRRSSLLRLIAWAGVTEGGLPDQLPEAGVLVGADVVAREEAGTRRRKEHRLPRLRHLQSPSDRRGQILDRFDLDAVAQEGGDQPVAPGSRQGQGDADRGGCGFGEALGVEGLVVASEDPDHAGPQRPQRRLRSGGRGAAEVVVELDPTSVPDELNPVLEPAELCQRPGHGLGLHLQRQRRGGGGGGG